MCGPNDAYFRRKQAEAEAQINAQSYNPRLDYSREILGTPESRLAKLMSRDLKVTVTDRELRLFIKAHWSKISALAHQIHDEE